MAGQVLPRGLQLPQVRHVVLAVPARHAAAIAATAQAALAAAAAATAATAHA